MKEMLEYSEVLDFTVRLSMMEAVCPVCGSGEVHQPAQTMDMPMWMKCLNCNERFK